MDRAIKSLGSEPSTRQFARLQAVGESLNGHQNGTVQAGLFEQLLSLPVPTSSSSSANTDRQRTTSEDFVTDSHCDSCYGSSQESEPSTAIETEQDDPDLDASTLEADEDDTPREDPIAALVLVNSLAQASPSESIAEASAATAAEEPPTVAVDLQERNSTQDASAATADAKLVEPLADGQLPATDVSETLAGGPDGEAQKPTVGDHVAESRASVVPNQESPADTTAQQEATIDRDPKHDGATESTEELLGSDEATLSIESNQKSDQPGSSRGRNARQEKWYAAETSLKHSLPSRETDLAAAQSDAVQEQSPEVDLGQLAAQVLDESLTAIPELPAPVAINVSIGATGNAAAGSISGISSSLVNSVANGESGLDGSAPASAGPSSTNSASKAAASSARPEGADSQSSVLTQQERVRLVQRVSRSFARLGPTGGQINIKLHPPQLGSLNVQVRLEGRTMTAKLSTETAAARDAILESLPVLRSRLAEQGFEVSQFQVEVADNNSNAADASHQQTLSDPSDNGQRAAPVDYRRLNLQRQRAGGEIVSASPRGLPAELLFWETTAGIDLHA